jgi:hypothetical protein
MTNFCYVFRVVLWKQKFVQNVKKNKMYLVFTKTKAQKTGCIVGAGVVEIGTIKITHREY